MPMATPPFRMSTIVMTMLSPIRIFWFFFLAKHNIEIPFIPKKNPDPLRKPAGSETQ
jgi:hypothetical protein